MAVDIIRLDFCCCLIDGAGHILVGSVSENVLKDTRRL